MLKATSSSTYKCVTVHIVRPAATARTAAGAVIHFVHIKAHFSVQEEGGGIQSLRESGHSVRLSKCYYSSEMQQYLPLWPNPKEGCVEK